MKLNNLLKKIGILCLTLAMAFTLVGCGDDEAAPDTLLLSSQELDKVFNPFFSTSGADSNVVGFTQMGMLGNNKEGKYTYGDEEAVVTKDLQIVTKGTENVDQTTTYYFVLKNNVKFSNGSPLTIKDVLFNLYVYLDPAYTGSSTIYSTDIVGLQQYRTQEDNEKEQENFKLQFEIAAETRIDALVDAAATIFDEHKDENMDSNKFKEYLGQMKGNNYANVVQDFEKAVEFFKEELESDYTNSVDSYEDITFADDKGVVYKNVFTTDVEAFLYNEGYISWNKKEGKLYSSLENDPKTLKTYTKEKAINTILEDKIPNSIEEVVLYWNTAINLSTYLVNVGMEEYFKNNSDRKYPNISGIQFANRTSSVEVNGVNYAVPTYNSDGSAKEGSYEVLSIQIHDVDPKAIWNFSFGVAPMYYYSSQEYIDKFDFVSNFGVEHGSQTFMNDVVKASDKIGVPVGAGPYAASKASGGLENVESGDFYSKGMVYFESNPYYLMGEPKIKKLRLQVVPQNQMLSTLYKGDIDFVEPNAKPETIKELDGKKSDGIGNKSVRTSGYGYIGINASKVPSLAVRQVIMHSINTQECVDYYVNTATPIYRSMSLSSWAYPKGATPYYPYIGGKVPENLKVVNPAYAEYVTKLGKKAGDVLTKEEQADFITGLIEGAGYTLNSDDIYQNGSNKLIYTFTIAGAETDHPAWQALYHAKEVLENYGFQITVKPDQQALRKLATGDLEVWAAAWGSTIDPDMYQVYHKESNATSVKNWGYPAIEKNSGGIYDTEVALIDELSEYIDKARKTTDESQRAALYSKALDIVMQLAIELPTYQRDDLFAYNTNHIDVNSLTPDSELSPFKGLLSDIHTVALNLER